MSDLKTCPTCLGEGEVFDGEQLHTCPRCKGTGTVESSEDENQDEEYPAESDFEEFDENQHSPLD